MATRVKKEVELSVKDLASKTLESLSYKFKKFEGALKSVQSAAGNVARSARGIVTAFGGVATAGVAAINKMANQADDLQTMANIVGLNVVAYQKLRYAAEQNDVSTENFDKSLQMLSKTMGELRSGTGTLYTRLKRTNPALLKQLRGAKDNETAFRLMMDAINKAGTAQKKAYLATAAFGRSGQALISLGNAGADVMARFEAEAESFGLVSEAGGTAADEWGRAVVRVRKALEGVGFTVLNQVLPSLIPVVNRVSEWIIKNRELIATRVIEWGKKFYNVLKTIAGVVGWLIQLFSKYSWLVYAVFAGKTLGLLANILKFIWALGGLAKATWALNSALLACPITWIVAAVAAVTALMFCWEDFNAWLDRIIDKFPKLKLVFGFIRYYLWLIKAPLEAIRWAIKGIIDYYTWLYNNFKDTWLYNKVKSWFGGDSTVTIEENVTPKYSPNTSGVSSGLQLSPLAGSQAQIATMGGMSQSADINVRFDNMPPMTRIETITSDTNLDLEIYRGVNGGTIQ